VNRLKSEIAQAGPTAGPKPLQRRGTRKPVQVPELQAAAEKLQLEVERLTAEALEVPISELQDLN